MASGQVPRQAKVAERRSGRRRAAGEGSIYRTSEGTWRAVADLGWYGGRRQRKYVRGATQAEVLHKCTNCSVKRRPVSCTGTRPRRAVAPVLAGTCRQRRPARLSRTRGDQFEARLKALLIAPKHRLLRL